MDRKYLVHGAIIAALLTYALGTGGIAIERWNSFGFQKDIRLGKDLILRLSLEPKKAQLSIPFVFHYYWGKPFGLRLGIVDYDRQCQLIEITDLTVQCHDGSILRPTERWTLNFRPETYYNSSSSGIIQTDVLVDERRDRRPGETACRRQGPFEGKTCEGLG